MASSGADDNAAATRTVTISLVFPWIEEKRSSASLSLKWNIGNTKYEIAYQELCSIKPFDIVPHTLGVLCRIEQAVHPPANVPCSFLGQFERTLDVPLQGIWQSVLAAQPALPNNPGAWTTEMVHSKIRAFFASHMTAHAASALKKQLENAEKPHSMAVRSFYHRLMILNTYIPWLPGDVQPLNPLALSLAFYQDMPKAWKARFTAAGKDEFMTDLPELLDYFAKQETAARTKAAENAMEQRRKSRSNGKRQTKNLPAALAKPRFNGNGKRKSNSSCRI